MSGMTIGSVREADKRLRAYEVQARRMRKVRRDAEVWRRYEEDYARSDNRNTTQPERTPISQASAMTEGNQKPMERKA